MFKFSYRHAIVSLAAIFAGTAVYAVPSAALVPVAAHADPAKLGSISGTVVDSAGKPVAGATVALHHHHKGATSQPQTSTSATHPKHRTTVTDASGHFSFDKVIPGRHLLVAHEKGVGHGHVIDKLAAGGADTVTITLAQGKPGGKK